MIAVRRATASTPNGEGTATAPTGVIATIVAHAAIVTTAVVVAAEIEANGTNRRLQT